MEAYLRVFIYYKQNNWTWLLSMPEFAYNNTKNASIGHMPIKLNYCYHSRISYKEDMDSCFKSKSVDELSIKLQELMTLYKKNFYHAQKL